MHAFILRIKILFDKEYNMNSVCLSVYAYGIKLLIKRINLYLCSEIVKVYILAAIES
jgi:hypothetical protein